jgi:ABC-type lipoprotein release transport system permease subunit
MNKTKKIILVTVIAIITVGTLVAFASHSNSTKNQKKKQQTASSSSPHINYSPPTKEDSARVDQNKQAIVDKQQAPTNPNATEIKTVVPTITYADEYQGQVEVGAYVSGIFENSGTCTATFTLGSKSLTQQTIGVTGASSVNCPAMTLPVTSFEPKGVWSVTVTYTSPTAKGISKANQVSVN